MAWKFKRWSWFKTAMVLLLLLVLGWGVKAIFFPSKAAPQYTTAKVLKADIENAVLATGILQAFRKVDVGAQVSGQLQKLEVELGDRVKKGQLLATIDPELAQNEALNAEASLEGLLAQMQSTQLQLEQAKTEYARQQTLLSREATSKQALEEAGLKFRTLQSDLAQRNADIKKAKLTLDSAKTRLGYTRILAPIDGEVAAITTLEGQTVIAAQQAPNLLTLANLDTITVKAQISEADVMKVRAGQTVYFTTLGQPDKRYYGKLRAIQPTPEKVNNAIFYNALFEVPNPVHALRQDMTAQVAIVLDHAKSVLTIPAIALGVKAKDGRYTVRVVGADGIAVDKQIKTGLNNNVQVQVLDGLKEGDLVVTGDAALSKPETSVTVGA
ncbi:macrolide transporter subunit MacA [Iodobacter sp. HSC-16F04]|uniref:Macrolide transporter subunit MacA n=1 Tax=Iodobacter violaceini TaxID=3044271 RepID=A0ABX0KRF0_9NEIS|nr:macrolide transporter subunit MacA [Iodobacter violacea]NHQ87215.1 macrolide transporter subunit MacA [Iodobacter violacea]